VITGSQIRGRQRVFDDHYRWGNRPRPLSPEAAMLVAGIALLLSGDCRRSGAALMRFVI